MRQERDRAGGKRLHDGRPVHPRDRWLVIHSMLRLGFDCKKLASTAALWRSHDDDILVSAHDAAAASAVAIVIAVVAAVTGGDAAVAAVAVAVAGLLRRRCHSTT